MSYQWNGPDQIAALVDAATGHDQFAYDPRGHLVGATFGDGVAQYRGSDAVSNLYRTPDGRDRVYGRGGRLDRVG